MEERKLARVQASLLLSHWVPALSVNPSRGNIYWLSGAIAIAKEMGLHLNASISRYGSSDWKLLKRVWWCCVLRDAFLAITYRRPPTIRLNDYDIPPLMWDDVMDDPEESDIYDRNAEHQLANMFAHLTRMAPLVCKVLEARFSPATRPRTDQSLSAGLNFLLDVERTNTELGIWYKAFLSVDNFSYVDSEETISKAIMFHRNFVLIFYKCVASSQLEENSNCPVNADPLST